MAVEMAAATTAVFLTVDTADMEMAVAEVVIISRSHSA